MDMIAFWMFTGCVIFLIIGIMSAIYYHRRVKSWKSIPTVKEYMECIFIGWCSWMLIIIAGGCTIFIFPVLLENVAKFLF